MTQGHDIDGELAWWDGVAPLCRWKVLLLGNGLSTNVWAGFDYKSLYEKAAAGSRHGGLAEADKVLFASVGDTTNFERVLAELKAAITMANALGQDAKPYADRYASIKRALGAAVRASHIEQIEIPESTFRTIRDAMLELSCVFTTSYDLLAYWAMSLDGFEGFCDCFYANNRNEFGTWVPELRTPVFFLHGALHLVVEADGTTRKLKRDDRSLLEQFGNPAPDDPESDPLLVTEGSSRDKLAVIEQNDYLAYVLQRLRESDEPLVVFGHSLSEQDAHLVDAINLHPDRSVAVSLLPSDTTAETRGRQAEIRARLHAVDRLYFFDASTHPLGAPELRAEGIFNGTGMFGRG
ncbi:MAG: hypothetical protein JWR63_864 [Conexibacter sp.]|nr:hypothetical protein [Conexibacter sp.]